MNSDITVVITCFNYGAFLPESVESALTQEGGSPRVIVVDDDSTDPDTLTQLDRLPADVQLLRVPHGGLAEARNSGLRVAQTPYVLMLDADDRLTPDALARMRAPLEADRSLGVSYGMVRFFGAWEGILKLPPFDPYRLLYRNIIGAVALTRREVAEDIGGYDSAPVFKGYEDWEYWLHALARGWRFARVDAVTLLYRRHGTTMYARSRSHYRWTFRGLRQKHAALYRGAERLRVREESTLNWVERLANRWWWGLRPLPARVEMELQALLWRPR